MYKIAIVEDEDLLRSGLISCIEWNTLECEIVGSAGDGKEGLALIERLQPDIVLTDIRMPHMDGIEMTEKVKELFPKVRVIILSGYDEFSYAQRAMKAGVTDYILKPVNLALLKKTILSVTEEIRKEQEISSNYEKLKTISQESIYQLRKGLYVQLLLHGRDIGTLGSSMEKIDDLVNGKFYAAGIIERIDSSILSIDRDYLQIMEMDRSFDSMVLSRADQSLTDEDRKHIEILHSRNCERVFCIAGDTNEEVRAYVLKLQKIYDVRQEDIECTEVSFGPVLRELDGLVKSMKAARECNEKKFSRKFDKSFDIGGKTKEDIHFINYDSQSLFFEIRSGTPEGIRKCLDELRDSLYRDNITSYLQIVMIVSNLYFELLKLPAEIGGDSTEILGNPMETYKVIMEKHSRHEIVDELAEVCYRIHDSFSKASAGKMQGILKQVEKYIAEHYTQEDLSMADVAGSAFISTSYLSLILKKETGKTYIEYLTDVRIQKARMLLENTDMKTYEIATACGYATAAYFSTVFKGICGVTPMGYRKDFRDFQKK